jgi:hypothetical protein
MNAAAVLGILFLSLSALGVMPESQIVQIANGGGSLRGKLKSESSLRVRRHTGCLHIRFASWKLIRQRQLFCDARA